MANKTANVLAMVISLLETEKTCEVDMEPVQVSCKLTECHVKGVQQKIATVLAKRRGLSILEGIGGPDRDRTDNLFRAMKELKPQNIDGTGCGRIQSGERCDPEAPVLNMASTLGELERQWRSISHSEEAIHAVQAFPMR